MRLNPHIKKTPRPTRRFWPQGPVGLLRYRLLEHAIDFLVRRIDRGLSSLRRRQRLVGGALRAARSLGSLVRGALGRAGRARSGISRRLRCVYFRLQLADLLLQAVDITLHRLEVSAAGERNDRNGRGQLHYDTLVHFQPLLTCTGLKPHRTERFRCGTILRLPT